LAIALAACSTVDADTSPPENKNLYFASGKAEPKDNTDYFELGRVAQLLSADEALHVLVIGHTDSIGSSASNRTLAFERADTIQELLSADLPSVNKRTQVAFYGEEQPAGPNKTSEGRAMNRRVELYFYYLTEDEDEEVKLQTAFNGKLEFRAHASAEAR
jgi:outer membrane protein OmpA-like peptidoglycan-associated protein